MFRFFLQTRQQPCFDNCQRSGSFVLACTFRHHVPTKSIQTNFSRGFEVKTSQREIFKKEVGSTVASNTASVWKNTETIVPNLLNKMDDSTFLKAVMVCRKEKDNTGENVEVL